MKDRIKNLLFDLGNVIIDIDVPHAWSNLEKLFRPDADREKIERIMHDYECGRISTELFLNGLMKQSYHTVQALDIIEAWNSMLLTIPPHRLEMLRSLRDRYQVYLLSNTNSLHLEWVHRYLDREHKVSQFEEDHFHHAFYSHLIGDRKPQSSIFTHIIQVAPLDPNVTLYMDDIQENLDAASQLGFATYLVKPGEDISEYLKAEGFF